MTNVRLNDIGKRTSEHSFDKHGYKFSNEQYGKSLSVKNKDDYHKHVVHTLENVDTKCFEVKGGNQKGTIYFYNEKTNTMGVIPSDKESFPTCYRPDDFKKHFDKKCRRAEGEQGYQPEIKQGIYDLKPEWKKEQETQKQEGKNIENQGDKKQNQQEEQKVAEKAEQPKQEASLWDLRKQAQEKLKEEGKEYKPQQEKQISQEQQQDKSRSR